MHICLSFSTRKSSMQRFPTFIFHFIFIGWKPNAFLFTLAGSWRLWLSPLHFLSLLHLQEWSKPWSFLYAFLCWEFLLNNIVDITALGIYCQNLIIWCLCHIITYSFQSLLKIGSYCACNHIFITCLWHLSLSVNMSWSGMEHNSQSFIAPSLTFTQFILLSSFFLCCIWFSVWWLSVWIVKLICFPNISVGFASHLC